MKGSRRAAVGVLAATAMAGCSLLVDSSGLSGGADPARGDATTASDALAEAGGDATPVCRPDVDLATDPKNCGRCGHGCLGGACIAARCQAMVFIEGEKAPAGVGTDGKELFWSGFGGSIRAMRLDGTGAIRAVAMLPSAGHIEVDDAYVYTADRASKRIVRISKSAGTVEPLAVCAGQCLGVAIFGGAVYFPDRGTSTLRMVGPDGGGPVATGLNAPEDAFATQTDVFVANENDNSIIRVPRDGTPPSKFLTVTDPVSVAIEGGDLFVVSQNAGTIYRRPFAGGSLDPVATGQAQPVGLLVTATAVYWANLDAGRIMRLAR